MSFVVNMRFLTDFDENNDLKSSKAQTFSPHFTLKVFFSPFENILTLTLSPQSNIPYSQPLIIIILLNTPL